MRKTRGCRWEGDIKQLCSVISFFFKLKFLIEGEGGKVFGLHAGVWRGGGWVPERADRTFLLKLHIIVLHWYIFFSLMNLCRCYCVELINSFG